MDIIDFILYCMIGVCVIALIWCQIQINRLKADDANRQCDYEIQKMQIELDKCVIKRRK